MPGIVGLITKRPRTEAEAELRTMLGAMRHDPTYSAFTWIDPELGLYVGKTARTGSFSDVAPQQGTRGDVTLIFSGEEYPTHDATRRAQRAAGDGAHRSAYLVGVCESDPTFPAALNGLFHGVVVDRRAKAVRLFNDRYGMHRLYICETSDTVYFAAEAKALLAVRPERRRLDPRGLAETILLGCVVEDRTIFDGVALLPGGSLWTFENARPTRKAHYFRAEEWERQDAVSSEEFYRQIRDTFTRHLDLFLDGPERVGVSLTGGLDSRMIMAWQRKAAGSLPTYTWGGPDRDCRDVTIAREVARICRQPHHVIPLGGEFLSRFADYANRAVFLSDGLVDTGLAPDVYWNEAARHIAPIRLTGLYGGEVLRRHLAFKPVSPAPGLFAAECERGFDEARQTYGRIRQGHPLTFAVFRQAPWHHYGSFSLEQTQVGMRTPFLDNDLIEAVYRAPEIAASTNAASMQLIADGNVALAQLPTDRGLGGRGGWTERASRTVQEVLFKAEYWYDYGMPPALAKFDYRFRALHLERLFLGRHRPHYFRVWYRDRLSSYVREMLLDRRSLSRPYVDARVVREIVEAHLRGERNYTTEIHKLLRLELLHRTLIDAPPVAATLPEPIAVHA